MVTSIRRHNREYLWCRDKVSLAGYRWFLIAPHFSRPFRDGSDRDKKFHITRPQASTFSCVRTPSPTLPSIPDEQQVEEIPLPIQADTIISCGSFPGTTVVFCPKRVQRVLPSPIITFPAITPERQLNLGNILPTSRQLPLQLSISAE